MKIFNKTESILRDARKQLGLSLQAVADGIGLSATSIHHYEKFLRYPTANHAYRLIKFYEKHGIFLTLEDCYPKYRFMEF